MLMFIWTVVKLLIIISLVATIHEFGHFLFAKLFKMKVNEFGIGFGKAILKKEYKGTIYSIRWIPLGGFVALEGEDKLSEDENSFSRKPWWQRIIVLLAGATFNAILAIVIFLSINMTTPTYTTQIKKLDTSSVLYEAGVREGDKIKSIEKTDINIFQDIMLYNKTDKSSVDVTYERNGKEETTNVKDAVKEIGQIGIYFQDKKDGYLTSIISVVEGGKPAVKVGLKAGDKIISVDGMAVTKSFEVTEIISKNANKEIDIVVERNGEEISNKITPSAIKSFNLQIGDVEKVKTTVFYSYCKSVSSISQIVNSYVDLFKGRVKVNQLSGIVGIGEVVSKTEGILEFINLIGIISLAIGLANVMPFPPLDGGKIVLVLIEAITRKKVSEKVEIILSYIGLGLLVLLTLYVTYNDITRLI